MAVNLQHEKILLLYDLFVEKSDKEHTYSLKDITEYLKGYNIHAERKSIYRTIALLKKMGLDIVCVRENKRFQYYLNERDFKPAELKMLIDTVQSSKFISISKSKELIEKIAKLGGEHLAENLKSQVTVINRVKQDSSQIFVNIDKINEAINNKLEISFLYYRWVMGKKDDTIVLKKQTRDEKNKYRAIPRVLMWDDENYYLVAYDIKDRILKNFRVDRMGTIKTGEKATSVKGLEKFDPGLYAKRIFGMYGGEIKDVVLKFDTSLLNPVIDKFGTKLTVVDYDDTSFTIKTSVMLSPQFFSWLFGFKEKAMIEGPEDAVDMLRDYLNTVSDMYK